MKKILNISAVAVLAALPTFVFADGPTYQGGAETTVNSAAPYALSADAANDGTNVVTASYVKGAYNDAIRKINTVAANATSNATTQITQAAGNGLAGANGKLSVDMTTNGGLELAGDTEGSKTLSVKTDGTTITKTAQGALQVGAITESQVTNLTTDLGNKQAKLQNDETTPVDINASVLTAVRDSSNADDVHLVTESAVRDAIDTAATGMVTTTTLNNKSLAINALSAKVNDDIVVTENATQTLTNKTFDANATGNSISNLETGDFASGVIVDSTTGIGATGSDTALPTEKAVREAITAATSTAGMVTTTTLSDKSLAVNASSLKVNDKDAATQSGVNATIAASTVTIPVLATWNSSETSNGSVINVAAATYTDQ